MDGWSTAQRQLDEVRDKLCGPSGIPVKLTLARLVGPHRAFFQVRVKEISYTEDKPQKSLRPRSSTWLVPVQDPPPIGCCVIWLVVDAHHRSSSRIATSFKAWIESHRLLPLNPKPPAAQCLASDGYRSSDRRSSSAKCLGTGPARALQDAVTNQTHHLGSIQFKSNRQHQSEGDFQALGLQTLGVFGLEGLEENGPSENIVKHCQYPNKE